MILGAFRDAWRSMLHVGPNKPTTIVMVQRGLMDHAYRPFVAPDDEDFGFIGGSKHNADPWHAFWRPTGDWITLPNVQHVETSVEFQQDGLADPETATIVLDNIIYQETNTTYGLFHRIRRGFLSPWRGWTNGGQRNPDPGAEQNEWFDVLNGGYRVRIYQGYGTALVRAFTGLIDDTDVTTTPDQITLTCRSFGQLLTDQRVFGSNKAKELKSPIVFVDRGKANAGEKASKVGGGANASTSVVGHPAVNVTKEGDETFWMSHAHTTPDNTEWVQVRLPKGTYRHFYVAPEYEGMEMFLSIYARHKGMKGKAKIDGTDVDDGFISLGLGTVPGDNGGEPYVHHWPRVSKGGLKRSLPFTLECGDDTVLRISFRNLGKHAKGDYRAECSRLVAYKITKQSEDYKKHHILVDDAADIIKWVLMWAGFTNWNVEPMGIHLKSPYTVDQSMFMADIIKDFCAQSDYTFFIEGFSDEDEADIGTPNFVRTKAIQPPGVAVEEVRDTDLLTDIDIRFTKEPLSYIIRVRGKMVTAKAGGVPLGGDPIKRVMATYLPPWSGAHHDVVTGQYSKDYPFAGRLSGVIKHVVHSDDHVESPDEAMMMALLIAIQEALAALGAQIEIPGHPGLSLNEQISIVDTASGANTRMWINHRSTTWTGGEDAEFKTTLAGAMVDSPDLYMVALDYLYFLAAVQREAQEKA